MNYEGINSRDLYSHYTMAGARAARLIKIPGYDDQANESLKMQVKILAEFRRRNEWPGDLVRECIATENCRCDSCGGEIAEGDQIVECAGGETGPGAIGYHMTLCMACDAAERRTNP